MSQSHIDLLADDIDIKLYRPRLNTLTGDAHSTLLLCQIIYWRKKQGKAFFKPKTVDGSTPTDLSFATELQFSGREVERAAKNLVQRGLIKTWYQRLEHRTWWDTTDVLEQKIKQCYSS